VAQTPSFQVEEVDGLRRYVALRGRTLPYQGVDFGGSTRTKRTTYAGNPVASIQVLGPEFDPTEIHGMWKDRFVPEQAIATGFEGLGFEQSPTLAEHLVRVFESLQQAGAKLRVQWGAVVRFGVLKKFTPSWVRAEDVSWSAEFEWSGAAETMPRASLVPNQGQAIRTALNGVDDVLPFDPFVFAEDIRDLILGGVGEIRVQVGVLFDGLRAIQSAVELPLDIVGRIIAAADSVRVESRDLLGEVLDSPYTKMTTADGVVDVLNVEGYRRTVGARVFDLRGTSIKQARTIEKAAAPGAISIVRVAQDTTLRMLSLRFYGTSDAWQGIADVNGFVDSQVPAGTVVIIPPIASSQRRPQVPTTSP